MEFKCLHLGACHFDIGVHASIAHTPNNYQVPKVNYALSSMTACAAARRAIGTRKGEQDT